MEVAELLSWITDGLDDAGKASVTAALTRDAVRAKIAGVKKQDEYDAIATQRANLAAELEDANGQPGARATKKWYDTNVQKIIANDQAIVAFDKKHGTGAFAKLAETGELPVSTPATPTVTSTAAATGLTKAEVEAMIAARPAGLTKEEALKETANYFHTVQAPNISNVLKTTARIMQRHMLAGRKNEVDLDALEKIMDERSKVGKPIDIEEAYAQWDAPEREKIAKASGEAEIERRVNEELQKRGATAVPGGADATPSGIFASKPENFNRDQLLADMAKDLAGVVN